MNLSDQTPFVLNDEIPDHPITNATRALPAGSRLSEFEIEEILHEGSVAVVYATTDRALDVPVVISEYMPARLARRNDDGKVAPSTSAQAAAFADGLAAFVNETRTLARCDHPSLVRVLRLWEANGTAYRVMPRYPTRRLLDVRPHMGEPPDEHALRALLDALLGALEAFHFAGDGHGKVTPSNILLLDNNRPLLLGPGTTARAIASDRTDALMTSTEPCFAPIEQIVETNSPLHPSVDLYALAGVARYWISGQLPAPSLDALEVARPETLADTVQRLRLTWQQLHYSAALLDALDSALSIYPAERPRSVAEMRSRLDIVSSGASGRSNPAQGHADPVRDGVTASAATAEFLPPPRVEQDLHFIAAPAADPDVPEPPVYANVDDEAPARLAVATQPKPRRIAILSGVLVALLVLGVVVMPEFGQRRQLAHALLLLGIDRGAADNATVTASAERPAAPTTPLVAANVGTANVGAANVGAANVDTANVGTANVDTANVGAANVDTANVDTATEAAPEAGSATSKPKDSIAADGSAEAVASATPGGASADASAGAVAPAAVVQPPASKSSAVRASEQNPLTATPSSPRETCGTRTQFSLYRCMQTQCSQPQWASHAQCERLRATDSAE